MTLRFGLTLATINTCNIVHPDWSPGDGPTETAETGDTGEGVSTNPVALELEDMPYSYRETIPDMESVEVLPFCDTDGDGDGDCYKCLEFDNNRVILSFWDEEHGSWTVNQDYNYTGNFDVPGSYTVEMKETWTAVQSNGPLDSSLGYIVIEPKIGGGSTSVLTLSICPELE